MVENYFTNNEKSRLEKILSVFEHQIPVLKQKIILEFQNHLFENTYALHPWKITHIVQQEIEGFRLFLKTLDREIPVQWGKSTAAEGLTIQTLLSFFYILQDTLIESFEKKDPEIFPLLFKLVRNYKTPYITSFFDTYTHQIHLQQKQLHDSLHTTVTKQHEKLAKQERQLHQNKINILEEQSKQKTAFLINFAHDIKLPLTIIHNTINILKHEAGMRKLPSLPYLELEIQKMKSMIIDILDYEKILMGKMLYDHNKIVNISSFTAEKIQLFQPIFMEKEIDISTKIENDLYINIAPYALDRVLNNIIDNAVKYSTRDRKELFVGIRGRGKSVILTIKDSGTGIPREHLKYICKPYFQSIYKNKRSQGIGMGLPIVKSIINEVSGSITIASEVHKGTAVTISFKRTAIDDSVKNKIVNFTRMTKPAARKKIELKQPEYDKNKYTVFIVEDHKELLLYMQNNMREFNFYYAFDGLEALRKLKTIPKPDIILSDIMMDRFDGYEFFEKFKEIVDFKNIPFIFLTAKTALKEKLKGLQYGAIDFIEKPFSIQILKQKIINVLHQRDINSELYIEKLEKKIVQALRSPDKAHYNYERADTYNLTSRERSIIDLLMKGLNNKEIGEQLIISTDTVKKHIRNIKEKCHVKNRIQLINFFRV